MRLLSLFLAFLLAAGAAQAEPRRISAEQALTMAEAGEILLVDIRTPEEWRQTGVAAPARLINMHDRDFVRDLQALMASNPDKPVAMICRTGNRSGFATKTLEKNGLKGLIDVSEGMAGSRAGPGWIKRGLPLRRADQPVTVGG